MEAAALDAAAQARLDFRRRRDDETHAAAVQLVAERRRPEITAVPAAVSVPGVYAWIDGPPRPGQRCRLVYNAASGPLAAGANAGAGGALLHFGYDGWWNQITQVVEFKTLTSAEAQAMGIIPMPAKTGGPAVPTSVAGGPPGAAASKTSGPGVWYIADVDVPFSAAVINWVVSDRAQRVWDNNGGRDFHTLVTDVSSGKSC